MENDIIWYDEYRIVAYKTCPVSDNHCFALQRRLGIRTCESKQYDWYSVFYNIDRKKCKEEWEKRLKNLEEYKEGR